MRVAIARALTSEPRLLVIDEPTIGVDLLARDGVLRLLRSIVDGGIAVLTSTGEGTGFLGADRVLSLARAGYAVRRSLSLHPSPTSLTAGKQLGSAIPLQEGQSC